MSWEANRAILDRDLAIVNAQPFVEHMRPVLVEVVNYATHALLRCNSEAREAGPGAFAPLALYHHMIEMADGVETLCAASAAVACVPLIRSMFEAWIGLQWILERDSEFERRGVAWVVGEARRELATLEQLDKGTPRGAAFRADLARDRFARKVRRPRSADIRRAVESRTAELGDARYSETVAEFDRLRGERGREPVWFSLFGGPADLEQLARATGVPGLYAVLYRDWSCVVHAGDGSRYSALGPEGIRVVGHLREPEELPLNTGFCVSIILDATRLMLRKFRSGEEAMHGRWYVEEVKLGLARARAFKFGKSVLAPGGTLVGRRSLA